MAQLRIPLLPKPLRWLGVGTIVATILYFSLVTNPPQPSGASPFWDKHLHFVAYAGLAVALAYATARQRERPYRRAALAIGGAVAFGALIELAQGTLSYRYFGWGDLLANTLGALLVSVWIVVEQRTRYVKAHKLAAEIREN